MSQLKCPGQQKLSDYLLGKLRDQESSGVERHVKDCLDCLSQLDKLNDQEDGIIAAAKRPAPDDIYESEPQCEKMMAMGVQLGIELGSAPTSSEAVDLGYVRDYKLI